MIRRPPAPTSLLPEAAAQGHYAIGKASSQTHHAPQLSPLHLLPWHPSRVTFSSASDRPSRHLLLVPVHHRFRISSTRSKLQSIFFMAVESTLTLIRSSGSPESSQRNPVPFNYAAPVRSTTEPLAVHEHITLDPSAHHPVQLLLNPVKGDFF